MEESTIIASKVTKSSKNKHNASNLPPKRQSSRQNHQDVELSSEGEQEVSEEEQRPR